MIRFCISTRKYLAFKKQSIPFKYQPNKFCRAKGHLDKIKCAKNGLKKVKEKESEPILLR